MNSRISGSEKLSFRLSAGGIDRRLFVRERAKNELSEFPCVLKMRHIENITKGSLALEALVFFYYKLEYFT